MEGFELSAAVSADNVFLINFAELQERLDPLFYNTVHGFSLVKHTTFPVKKLSEVIDMQRGRFGHRPRNEPKFYGGQYPFIQTGDVVKASQTNAPITYTQTLNELGLQTSRLFDKNVMVITIAANIGDTAILDYPACFPDSLIGITPKTEALTLNYLNIYFKFLKPYLEDIAPQSAQKNINYQQLSPVPIVVPPLAIQQNITDLYRDVHQQKQQKEQQAQTLLDGIDGYLLNELGITLPQQDNRLEKRMFTVPFSEVTGGSLSPDNLLKKKKLNFSSKYKFYVLGTIAHMYQPQTITQQDMTESGVYKVYGANGHIGFFDKYNHENSEVLVTCRGATCGEINLSEHKSWITGNAMVVKPIVDFVIQSYLFEILKCLDMSVVITGSAQPQITRENLKRFSIPVPPIEVQNEIVTYISQIRAQAKQLQADAAQVLATAKAEIERMILGENG